MIKPNAESIAKHLTAWAPENLVAVPDTYKNDVVEIVNVTDDLINRVLIRSYVNFFNRRQLGR